MAEHAHITDRRTPETAGVVSGRRRLGAGLLATVIGAGITAGAAASVADLVPLDPDAHLLSLHSELRAAVADYSWSEVSSGVLDEELTEIGDQLIHVGWKIVEAPRAQTDAGRALKAAGAMYLLRQGFNGGHWPGDGEAMAWDVLSELAGDVYVPPAVRENLRHLCEPERA